MYVLLDSVGKLSHKIMSFALPVEIAPLQFKLLPDQVPDQAWNMADLNIWIRVKNRLIQ